MVLTVLPERLKADVASGLAALNLRLHVIVALGSLRPWLGILARCNGPISFFNRLSQGQFFVDFFDALGVGLILVHEVAEAEPTHGLVLCGRVQILLKNAGGSSGHRLET